MRRPAIWEVRRVEAQSRIDAKIAVLQRYEARGIPPGAHVPDSMNAFWEWQDGSLGLERIGTARTMSVDATPHNKARIDEVVRLIGVLAAKPAPDPDEVETPSDTSRMLRNALAHLALAQMQVDDLRKQLAGMTGERDRLVAELNKVNDMLRRLAAWRETPLLS
jgi:hypothetical protein